MNVCNAYVLIAILASAIAISTSSAFAQGTFAEQACPDCDGDVDIYERSQLAFQNVAPILVWTNLDVYDHKSTVWVEGAVSTIRAGTDVGIIVIGPTNNIVTIDQVTVDSDGKFQTTLDTSSPLWKFDGEYTIRAQYGQEGLFDKVTIQLTGGVMPVTSVPMASCNQSEINARSTVGGSHCIPYSISGGNVISGTIDVGAMSLKLNVDGLNGGTIMLDIPRSVLDAKIGTNDGDFFVLVNDEETEVDSDEKTASSRTLTISFPPGTETIEVIGTFVIPEFGVIAAMILAVALVSIIAVSAKTRLRILPKI